MIIGTRTSIVDVDIVTYTIQTDGCGPGKIEVFAVYFRKDKVSWWFWRCDIVMNNDIYTFTCIHERIWGGISSIKSLFRGGHIVRRKCFYYSGYVLDIISANDPLTISGGIGFAFEDLIIEFVLHRYIDI
jgi:hypothetical protein